MHGLADDNFTKGTHDPNYHEKSPSLGARLEVTRHQTIDDVSVVLAAVY